jgi:1-acyl-sn-glycerol-3-phosphate acyltransferase
MGATARAKATQPARCAGVTAGGARCRNRAGDEGFCHLHAIPVRADEPLRQPITGFEQQLSEILGFLRRRFTGEYEVDDFGLDAELTEKVVLPLLRLPYKNWWRVEQRGTENIPREGAAMLVANHSGTLPLDAVMTTVGVYEATGRHLRQLAADLAMRLPFSGELARKTGNTLACKQDSYRLLEAGELVGVYPEGFKGVGKPFKERYKLQRFGRGGFVEVAVKAKVPIIPVAIVGAEEIYPIVGNIKPLARLLGFPYFPVTPLWPALGPLGLIPLPSKWIITYGEPIPTDRVGDEDASDPMFIFNLTDEVRETIQQMLYKTLMTRRGVFT